EAHQPGAGAAAGELLLLAADGAEVGAGAGAVLEEAGLALDEVVDAHQVVVDRLEEAGRALRPLVGALGLVDLAVRAGLGVLVPGVVARAPVDAVARVEPAVEPHRRVEGAVLVD